MVGTLFGNGGNIILRMKAARIVSRPGLRALEQVANGRISGNCQSRARSLMHAIGLI